MKAEGALHGWMPAWLAGYRREWVRPDVVAGLGAAAVVIPKSLAYATIAGLPVQVGLYTACVPMAIYALLGTSRLLSVSTTTTLAILAGAALAQVAAVHPSADPSANLLVASATLALLVGLVLGAACALRLGFVADFISEPVLVGNSIVPSAMPAVTSAASWERAPARWLMAVWLVPPPATIAPSMIAGLLILRPEGRVFFANARRLGQRMRQHVAADAPRVVLLDLSGVVDLEYTALKMLIEAERALGEQGVSLWLAGLNPEVLAMVRRAALAEALGTDRMFATLEQALVRFQSPGISSPGVSSPGVPSL